MENDGKEKNDGCTSLRSRCKKVGKPEENPCGTKNHTFQIQHGWHNPHSYFSSKFSLLCNMITTNFNISPMNKAIQKCKQNFKGNLYCKGKLDFYWLNSTYITNFTAQEYITVNNYKKWKSFRLKIASNFPCATILHFVASMPCPIVPSKRSSAFNNSHNAVAL